jgi:hypothetical protein
MPFVFQLLDIEAWFAATSVILLVTSELLTASSNYERETIIVRPSVIKTTGIAIGLVFVIFAIMTLVVNYVLGFPA